jgi:hypothetical protein
MLHISIQNLFQLQHVLQVLPLASPILLYQHLLDIPPDGLGNVVHILGLDDGMQVVLQYSGEVVLQLAASEVCEDFLPVWGILRHNVLLSRPDPFSKVKICSKDAARQASSQGFRNIPCSCVWLMRKVESG